MLQLTSPRAHSSWLCSAKMRAPLRSCVPSPLAGEGQEGGWPQATRLQLGWLCSAKTRKAVIARTRIGARKSGLPDLRIHTCRCRVNPTSVRRPSAGSSGRSSTPRHSRDAASQRRGTTRASVRPAFFLFARNDHGPSRDEKQAFGRTAHRTADITESALSPSVAFAFTRARRNSAAQRFPDHTGDLLAIYRTRVVHRTPEARHETSDSVRQQQLGHRAHLICAPSPRACGERVGVGGKPHAHDFQLRSARSSP